MNLRRLTQVTFATLLALPGLGGVSATDGAAIAQDAALRPSDAIIHLFSEAPILPEWFTEEFVEAVPPPRMQSIIEGLTADFGGLVSVQMDGRTGTIHLESALVPVEITLDGAGRIAGLLFQPPQPTGGTPEDVANLLLQAAPGEVAVMAAERSSDDTWRMHAAHRSTEPMAVGSAFKLAVLRAYEDAIDRGSLSRDDVVTLEAQDRSLPSGVLQTMQAGVPITVEALAGLMIQHSDNTATDALIRVLGRDAVEALSPRNRPFITTAELFKLIAIGGDADRAAFAAGQEGERRQILAELAERPLPDVGDVRLRATWPEVEWMFTAEELCDLLVSLRDAPALNGTPNPVVAAEGWDWIGFKGGSEFGVLNLSAAGVTPDGRVVCAVVSANAMEAQPEERIGMLFGSLFRTLGSQ